MRPKSKEMENVSMDQSVIVEIMTREMPYGKYKGTPLYRLPEPYLVWYKQKGFPAGRLGILLETLYEIKLNGLEYLLKPLANRGR